MESFHLGLSHSNQCFTCVQLFALEKITAALIINWIFNKVDKTAPDGTIERHLLHFAKWPCDEMIASIPPTNQSGILLLHLDK